MGLTESTYCGSNRKASPAKENVEYVKVVRRYEDEELLEQLANGVKRGGRGRRKNRRANRMLRRARAELINLKLGTDRKVSSMKREIEELNEYIEEMKRKGERVSTPKMKLLEQKNKQLSKMISKSKERILFDDKKILELEQYIQESESKKQNQVMKAFAMPSPANGVFGDIIMTEGLRGKYEVLSGNDLWGLFFYKVLIVDELQRLREDYKAELRKRAEEEKKRIEEMNAPPRIPLAPIPSMETFGRVDPKAKMKHVWWEPVDSVDLRNSVWAKIGYQNSKIDESALLSEFDQKKKKEEEKEEKQKIRKKKRVKNSNNKDDAASVLSMKRSIEMGIAYSKLKWTFEDIRTRLGENELFEILTPDHHLHLNGLTLEKVSFLLKLLPDKSEASMLRVKKPTSGMPFLSLRLYDELPDVHNRILSIEYWYRFRDIAMDLERAAYYVLKAAEVLEESKAFKKTLRMLRTIETKGNSKLSVLDFAMTQLNKFEKMGLELPEETECLTNVLGKGPKYLEKLYGELENMVTHVERATKKARAELNETKPKLDNTSVAFVKKFAPWIHTARKQLDRVRKLLRTVLKDKVEDVMNELVPDGKGSFEELMSQITRFSRLFLESRRKMLPDYVPRPRILWTPKKIGRSSPRMLLRKRVESTCLDGNSFAATPDTNDSKQSSSILRSSEKRRLICLPASTLPGLAKWVLRSKGLSPKKMEERSKSAPPAEKNLKRKEKSLPDMVKRLIKSDAKEFTTNRDKEEEQQEETKSRRELFPPEYK